MLLPKSLKTTTLASMIWMLLALNSAIVANAQTENAPISSSSASAQVQADSQANSDLPTTQGKKSSPEAQETSAKNSLKNAKNKDLAENQEQNSSINKPKTFDVNWARAWVDSQNEQACNFGKNPQDGELLAKARELIEANPSGNAEEDAKRVLALTALSVNLEHRNFRVIDNSRAFINEIMTGKDYSQLTKFLHNEYKNIAKYYVKHKEKLSTETKNNFLLMQLVLLNRSLFNEEIRKQIKQDKNLKAFLNDIEQAIPTMKTKTKEQIYTHGELILFYIATDYNINGDMEYKVKFITDLIDRLNVGRATRDRFNKTKSPEDASNLNIWNFYATIYACMFHADKTEAYNNRLTKSDNSAKDLLYFLWQAPEINLININYLLYDSAITTPACAAGFQKQLNIIVDAFERKTNTVK